MTTTEELIAEGARLKAHIDKMTADLKIVNKILADTAEFKKGVKTGYLVGGGYKVKVVLRDNVKWFQDRLEQVKEHFNDVFFEAFQAEYKPKAKVLDSYMVADPEFARAVTWAKEVKPGAPTVTYEPIEEVENAA